MFIFTKRYSSLRYFLGFKNIYLRLRKLIILLKIVVRKQGKINFDKVDLNLWVAYFE